MIEVPADLIALSLDRAEAIVGLSRRSLERLIEKGAIRAYKSGRRTLIDATSLRAYFDRNEIEPGGHALKCKPVRP